jgi:hypothetical protein
MISTKPGKSHYSEAEAAAALGVSIEQLRSLVRNHLIEADEDLNNLSVAGFQPSDLLLLKILSGRLFAPITQGSPS